MCAANPLAVELSTAKQVRSTSTEASRPSGNVGGMVHSAWPLAYWTFPAGHAVQFLPRSAVKVPAAQRVQLAPAALVLPSGPPEPAAHGVPSQEVRALAAAAKVPLGQGVQPLLQRHCRTLLQAPVPVLSVFSQRLLSAS